MALIDNYLKYREDIKEVFHYIEKNHGASVKNLITTEKVEDALITFGDVVYHVLKDAYLGYVGEYGTVRQQAIDTYGESVRKLHKDWKTENIIDEYDEAYYAAIDLIAKSTVDMLIQFQN